MVAFIALVCFAAVQFVGGSTNSGYTRFNSLSDRSQLATGARRQAAASSSSPPLAHSRSLRGRCAFAPLSRNEHVKGSIPFRARHFPQATVLRRLLPLRTARRSPTCSWRAPFEISRLRSLRPTSATFVAVPRKWCRAVRLPLDQPARQ